MVVQYAGYFVDTGIIQHISTHLCCRFQVWIRKKTLPQNEVCERHIRGIFY